MIIRRFADGRLRAEQSDQCDGVLDRVTFAEGQFLFREGDSSTTRAFLIQDGLVELIRMADDGREIALGRIGKGGILGELELFDDRPRIASARALEPSTAIVVTRAMLLDKVQSCDPFVRKLLAIFADTIRALVPAHHARPRSTKNRLPHSHSVQSQAQRAQRLRPTGDQSRILVAEDECVIADGVSVEN